MMGIKYSTARSIIKTFKNEGRVDKKKKKETSFVRQIRWKMDEKFSQEKFKGAAQIKEMGQTYQIFD
jgi:hypothetical protein